MWKLATFLTHERNRFLDRQLNVSGMQGDLLERLRGAPHVMQLIARGTCSYLNCNWHAVLFQPVVKLLTQSDPLSLVGQVGS